MMKTVALTVLLTLALAAMAWSSQPAVSVTRNLTSMPLAFAENQGQWDAEVKYRANTGGAAMWFASDRAYYQFTRRVRAVADDDPWRPEATMDRLETMVIGVTFVGANPDPRVVGQDMMAYKCNYFVGNDRSKWRTDVPNYNAVLYEDIYPGIDLKYYGNGVRMEYDFIIPPFADHSQIRIRYDGTESMSVNSLGQLLVRTKWSTVVEQKPVIYQVVNSLRVPVEGEYSLKGDNTFGFKITGDYDPSLPLVIDPVLTYSTYLGGSSWELASNIAVDGSHAAYVTGSTYSTDFPTFNPYQTDQGECDVFVTKLSAEGSSLIYSTYLGGDSADYGSSVAVDASGAACVVGRTHSYDFPTFNPYQTYQGGGDAFVTMLSASGNILSYSTFLGGSSADHAQDVVLDVSGAAYVTGVTSSANFPTLNPYQTDQWDDDVFVTKLSAAGNTLVYSTYLGHDSTEGGYGIAIDGSGCAYVTGYTSSIFFPTRNPYQTNQGKIDAFVTKLSPTGSNLAYSTYLGGDSADWGYDIALDGSLNAYVTGFTVSTDFPTLNPYQTDQGSSDAFVTKLSSIGNSLVYSTYLGGDSADYGTGIAVDGSGCAYVAGFTASTNFPMEDPYQTDQPSSDAFVTMFGTAGNSLVYSTYLGGDSADVANGIALDASDAVYVTGRTRSSDFPTENPFQSSKQGDWDAFVTKLTTSCCLLRGDIMHDGGVNPLDAVYFVNYMWLGGPPPPCMEEADVNGSGAVNPLDAVYLVNYFWNGGPPPVPCP